MKKSVPSFLKVRFSLEKICATELHDGTIFNYIEVVNYLLTTYTTDDTTAHATKKLGSHKQAAEVLTASYTNRLYTKALRCRIVYEERRLKSFFVE